MPLFGGSGSGVTGQQVSLPPWLEAAYRDVVERGEELSIDPYTPYPAPRLAEFTPDQTAGFDLARESVGWGRAIGEQGLAALQSSLVAPSASGLQPYLDPYNEEVIQNTLAELDRQNQILGQREAAQSALTGSFGGARTGVREANRARDYERTGGDLTAQMNAANFQQAMGQYNTQQRLQMEGAAGFGTLGALQQGLAERDKSSLLGIGALGQAFDQANLDIGYQDFQRQQGYPYQQLGFQSDILQGVPSMQSTLQTSTSQSQIPQPSPLNQVLGLGIAGLGLAKGF